jgi:hypothetical protein
LLVAVTAGVFEELVSIDPSSEAGKNAAQSLQGL